MTTIHGYSPKAYPDQLRSARLTLCCEPVSALADLREKVTDDVHEINCVRCLTSPLHVVSKKDCRPSVPEPLPEQHAALIDLLRRALAWRRQGAPSHWSTEPSQRLALEVDRLRQAFPALVEDLANEPERHQQHRPIDARGLVPEALRGRYDDDPIIHNAFVTAAYGGLTRESALIRCVQELLRDRGRLQHDLDGALRAKT